MNMNLKEKFSELWKKYFDDAELPITFYYTSEEGHAELCAPDSVPRCVVLALSNVRKGSSLCFNAQSISCFSGKMSLGFAKKTADKIEYFLSCGIPGRFEWEHYKKSPELAEESTKHAPSFKATAQFIVFKRWDQLEVSDSPEVVIFFAQPDVLSGLCTLAGFDEAEPNAVISPNGSGCSSIVAYPYVEKSSDRPRAVIGMFDPSARTHIPKDKLTFAVPMTKFVRMIENMESSFLITETWKKVQKRIS
jgi:uncharacterized protein (DUF169 family)